jgi:hypothetical protein
MGKFNCIGKVFGFTQLMLNKEYILNTGLERTQKGAIKK